MSPSSPTSPVIALFAGEVSGDQMAAHLIKALQKTFPTARFIGIGGDNMIAAGLDSWANMDELSVMGGEVIGRIFRLLRLRRNIINQLKVLRPAIVLGIDAPDFNFVIEKELKQVGVPAYHWVSPSVWAWRQGRIPKIGRSCDRILCLFPKEPAIYSQFGVTADYVGHPLADAIAFDYNLEQAWDRLLVIDPDLASFKGERIIGLLPGSRMGEVKRMVPYYFEVAEQLLVQNDKLKFILPVAKASLKNAIETHYQQLSPSLKQKIMLVNGSARDCMAVSEMVLLASGTATVEGVLLKKPMVVAHRTNRINRWIYHNLFISKLVSPANFIADTQIVDEHICERATVTNAVASVMKILQQTEQERQDYFDKCQQIHQQLRKDCVQQVADRIIQRIQ